MIQPTPSPNRIRIAVVDDDPSFRALVKETLAVHPHFQVVVECGSAELALIQLPVHHPDVVLMDIQMSGLSGIDCVCRLKPKLAGTKFMMLTVFEDYERIFESLKAGALGYLIKREVSARLADAVRDLHAGHSPISPAIARKMVQAFQQTPTALDPTADLSPRERQILHGLARGRQYKEIADELGVSFHTVRTHIGKIYEKLHVHSRGQAVDKLTGHHRVGPPLT